MARSTMFTYLMYKPATGSTTYTKLIDVKTIPDMGGAPERLQTTTLSNEKHTYIPGIQDTEELAFTANFDAADYQRLEDLNRKPMKFALYLGKDDTTDEPDGHEGIFEWEGEMVSWLTGGDVNVVQDINISITPSTDITWKTITP